MYEDLEIKDLPTIFIYGVDYSIITFEKEVVQPVKRIITGEKVSPDIPPSKILPPKSEIFSPKVEYILSTPYYELSPEEKVELNKSSWWVWLILLLLVFFLFFKKDLVRLW